MLPYIYLTLFILLFGVLVCEIEKSQKHNVVFLCIAAAGLIFMAAMRGNAVGVDYGAYFRYFKQVYEGGWTFLISSANAYRFEFGFSLLNYFVSLFSTDIHIFMLVVAVLVVSLICVMSYKYSVIPWVTIYVFVTFGYFGDSLSFIRQSIAIAILMFAIQPLKEKKLLKYVLIILLAASFHKAVLIMLPVYLIAHIKVNWKSLTIYGVIAALLSVLSWPLFNLATKLPAFQSYATKDGLFFMNGRSWTIALFPVIICVAAIVFKKFILQRDSNNVVLINFSIYSALLYVLTCQHFLYKRFGMIFIASVMLLIPELIKGLSAKAENAKLTEVPVPTEVLQEGSPERIQTTKLHWEKHFYYYSVCATIVIGFLYQLLLLNMNGILIVPYYTFVILW